MTNVNELIGPNLVGLSPTDQKTIDEKMVQVLPTRPLAPHQSHATLHCVGELFCFVQELDGSKNEWGWSKAKLGANAILGVSMVTRPFSFAFFACPSLSRV